MAETLLRHQVLELSQRKARYGLAYLEAVSFQAGVPVTPTAQDQDVIGIDCNLEFPEFSIRVQIKCTGRQLSSTQGTLSYGIEEKIFRKWRKNKLPVYLVVVIVPNDLEETWDDFSVDDQTLLRCAAYWTEVDKEKDAAPWTVPLNRTQRFTPATLAMWHERSLSGGFGG